MTITASIGSAPPATYRLTVTAPRKPAADLKISFSAVAAVPPGRTVRVQVHVSNAGPDTATAPSTTVTLPRGVELADTGGGRVHGATVTYLRPSLAAGGDVTYYQVVRPTRTAARSARLSGTVYSTTPDPNRGDNLVMSAELLH